MQGVFTESSLREQAWRNPKEGRVGCLHQNIFTRKVTEIAFTSDFCNNYSHPASPTSLYLMSLCPHPHVPASHTWCPQVSRLTSPSPKSPHMHPDVPIPLSTSHFYTQPKILTDVEQRYSQTGKEALALVWACTVWTVWQVCFWTRFWLEDRSQASTEVFTPILSNLAPG